MSPVLVSVPLMLSTPAIVSTLLLVTVLPLRLTDPSTVITPSFVTVAAWGSDRPGASTTIVPVARLITVARPLTFTWGRNLTLPSLSSRAPASAASAGISAVPRTKRRPDPLMLDGLKLAGPATQIVAPPALTDPVNVPDSNSTTSSPSRLRFGGILASL